jgi:AcrR family transcriptional regulator
VTAQAGPTAREILLDAAREELRGRPWREVTMAAVASAAGLSRQTVYNAFGSRERLAQALVLREADRFLDAVEGAVAAHAGDPEEALAAAFDLFLAAARDDPLVHAVVRGDEERS